MGAWEAFFTDIPFVCFLGEKCNTIKDFFKGEELGERYKGQNVNFCPDSFIFLHFLFAILFTKDYYKSIAFYNITLRKGKRK